MQQIHSSEIKVTDGSIWYGTVSVFRQLNLSVQPGTLTCITGPSGCGKSSLLKAVLGIVPLTQGQIQIGDQPLTEANLHGFRRQVAWVPQEAALPYEWVKEMVMLPFSLRAARKQPFREKAFFNFMQKLGLEKELYRKRVNEISGGQRQRFMLASAVLLNRPFLLIDEPTSALDAENAGYVLALLRETARKGATVLTVSHDHVFLEGCDQVFEMNRPLLIPPKIQQNTGTDGNY